MKIIATKQFKKNLQKLQEGEIRKFNKRRDLFLKNPSHPILHNHKLKGEWDGYRSINITGDLRVIFKYIEEDVAYFITIDTHSNLYE